MAASDVSSPQTAPDGAALQSHSEIQALLRAEIDALRQSLDARVAEIVTLTERAEALSASVRAEAEAEIATLRERHAIELVLTSVRDASLRDGPRDGVLPFQEQIDLLGQTELFDPSWYLQVYTDVSESGINPKEHYVRSGAFEGRDPGPHFSTMGYYIANPDVAHAGWPALVHYVAFGKADGRPIA